MGQGRVGGGVKKGEQWVREGWTVRQARVGGGACKGGQ